MRAEHNFYEVTQPGNTDPATEQTMPRQQSLMQDLNTQMSSAVDQATQVSEIAQQASQDISTQGIPAAPTAPTSLKDNPESFVTDYSTMEFELESGAKRSATNIAMGLGSAAAQLALPTQIATLTGPYSTAINTLFPLESVGIFGPQGVLEFAQNKET